MLACAATTKRKAKLTIVFIFLVKSTSLVVTTSLHIVYEVVPDARLHR
jgi:hypothetical protein